MNLSSGRWGRLLPLACALTIAIAAGATASRTDHRDLSYRLASLQDDHLTGPFEEYQAAWNGLDVAQRETVMRVFRDNVMAPVVAEAEQSADPTPAPATWSSTRRGARRCGRRTRPVGRSAVGWSSRTTETS